MALVLHVGVMDRRDAYKTLITAEYCRVKVKAMKADAKHSMLETAAGPVSKSNSMLLNLNGDLYPSSVYKYAQVEEWMEFASAEVEEGLKRWIYPRMGVAACDNDHWLEMRIVCVEHSLGVLNTHLAADKKYLVDNGLTLADITMACALHLGFTRAMTKSFTSKFPFVEKYFWNLVGQPEFKKFLGEVKQAESPPEWPLPGVGILDRNYVDLEMILERREMMRVNQIDEQKMEAHKEEGVVTNQVMEAPKAEGVTGQVMEAPKAEGANLSVRRVCVARC